MDEKPDDESNAEEIEEVEDLTDVADEDSLLASIEGLVGEIEDEDGQDLLDESELNSFELEGTEEDLESPEDVEEAAYLDTDTVQQETTDIETLYLSEPAEEDEEASSEQSLQLPEEAIGQEFEININSKETTPGWKPGESESDESSPTTSWEKAMTAEMGIDQELFQIHQSHHTKKLNIEALLTEMKGTPEERKRQAAYVEEILASYHMKDLTSKFGSKGKTPKQYFMEAYDDDTRLGRADEDQIHHYDSMGREVSRHHHKSTGPHTSALDSPNSLQQDNTPCSPIVFASADELLTWVDGKEKPIKIPSDKNFWGSLEDLEKLDDPSISDSALSWCTTTLDSPQLEEVLSKKFEDNAEDSSSGYGDQFQNDPTKETILNKYLDPMQEVVQSIAVRRAWERVMQHLEHFNVKDPHLYNLYGNIYQETRDFVKLPEDDVKEFEGGNWEPVPINEDAIFNMEPPEKLFGRHCIYQKALLYMIDHFETLRPILAEIKQCYTEVLDKGEKEWKEMGKLRLDQLRLKEAYATYVRERDKVGDRELMEVKLQTHALQEHLQWQQHTLHTILGVLSKMRHSLKMQSKAVQKTTTTYKNKVELLAKEIVSQQGQAMYEMALPGKYTELMAKFKNVKESKELRRILNAARRQLRKAHKQILFYETDITDA